MLVCPVQDYLTLWFLLQFPPSLFLCVLALIRLKFYPILLLLMQTMIPKHPSFFVGRDGLTHNMLNDIFNHWKHAEAVRIKCLGVPTVDMKNVCNQLEVLCPNFINHFHYNSFFSF